MTSNAASGSTRDYNESRKEALQALLSSLAPGAHTKGRENFSEEQIGALTEEIGLMLGETGGSRSAGRKDEGSELLNEEGLPIIDITEPISEATKPFQPSKAFVAEPDHVPLSALPEQERQTLRAQRDHVLDMLEEEEKREAEKAVERERRQGKEELAKRKDVSSTETNKRLAERDMQKKLGKALLKNLAKQRDREEKEKAVVTTTIANRVQSLSSNNLKPKKSVSFANVSEAQEEKPKQKPPVPLGDVSLGALRAGMPKAKFKADIMISQPMRLEVVERAPGEHREHLHKEQDSDDESSPEEYQGPEADDDDEENTPPLDGDFDDSGTSTKSYDGSENEDVDYSQARIQREVALEYIRLRESVGAEAQQALGPHLQGREGEWDQPEVPLEATLSSKPAKSDISRFKAARQAKLASPHDSLVSLGASVIPQGKSHTLKRAVRTGKLSDGQLVGNDDESPSDDEESESMKRMLDMLKNGIDVEKPQIPAIPSATTLKETLTNELPVASSSSGASATQHKASRFLAERTAHKSPSETISEAGPSARTLSSPVGSVVSERPVLRKPMQSSIPDVNPPGNGSIDTRTNEDVIQKITDCYSRAFRSVNGMQNSAVLSTMVIDSPSFPPPCASVSTAAAANPLPLASEVRESTRRANSVVEPTQRPPKFSRFKAEHNFRFSCKCCYHSGPISKGLSVQASIEL
ncbi:hypothetical protein EW145_g2080 [Phellinidium pouzarii]|uniref:DUF3835 domain-containing protein n=1 Tax=Phellinidium pouzarii TaxID=167371 RepID=A0A4S4LHP5_9AGAM|nr:hypothetical protein EW145_g2080 [Phellinidium pouzarii]